MRYWSAVGITSATLYGSTSPFTPRPRPPSTLRNINTIDDDDDDVEPLQPSPASLGADAQQDSGESSEDPSLPLKTRPMSIQQKKRTPSLSETAMGYGSFVPTPPLRTTSFKLPEPAIGTDSTKRDDSRLFAQDHQRPPAQRSASVSVAPNAFQVGFTTPPPKSAFASIRTRMPQNNNMRASMRRMFASVGGPLTSSESRQIDVDMIALDQVRLKQNDFFKWMDKELDKVETFYKEKEDEAGSRLKILREQLHEMRNRRIEEVAAIQQAKALRKEDERSVFDFHPRSNGYQKADSEDNRRPTSKDHVKAWLGPLERVIDDAKAKAFRLRPGSNSEALQNMKESPEMSANKQASRNFASDQNRDYIRRPHHPDEIPYRTAKKKLKLALQEFYRGMELLKSYALLNRTAFRKINKKYDKAINASPPLQYMSEKVNKSWFVQSDVLDLHMHAIEDLYARYFEKGNRKVAVGKLKSSSGKFADQSSSAFQNGMFIGTGTVFAIQGLIHGRVLLNDPDPTIRVQTSYLLQIYAGYFLALYLFCWFCLDCSIWARNKINYAFVFEFDPRHNLDWRELSEFPSFLVLVLGLFAWWRLLLAGLYPVEFRDFFLGDMYCSLTYCTGNIELFFCLYAHHWNNPAQCNSTHSRLLGFLSALPGIWRALQCLRRYFDTRNIFPHLVNCGKYGMTILYYVALSVYRLDQTYSKLALFITIATLNAIYCSVWDLLMDWSVLQPHASKKWLRDVRGFKPAWWYYGAMIIDPIFRFNWIFYAIYTSDAQHSSLVSFLVNFVEVNRRGIWTLFRVENEHCSNVAHFKASRDVPLPYLVHSPSEQDFGRHETAIPEPESTRITPSLSRYRSHTGSMLEAQQSDSGSSLRRRPAPARTFTSIVANAHTQDFEKKRKPGAGDSDSPGNRRRDGEDEDGVHLAESSDDDDENDTQDILDAEELIRARSKGPALVE
ncbi:hypothetical protein G7Y89_g15208 [Cudoniella acicularis]|uniref:EXS domain-containing protein n=1 Tax=Cudoniella acicularis TaxID=354080 RepID=A0A8H4VQB9_9HELO|nr:hypothetical protein G7Y89_g15208 [Cudoniella acicularis]